MSIRDPSPRVPLTAQERVLQHAEVAKSHVRESLRIDRMTNGARNILTVLLASLERLTSSVRLAAVPALATEREAGPPMSERPVDLSAAEREAAIHLESATPEPHGGWRFVVRLDDGTLRGFTFVPLEHLTPPPELQPRLYDPATPEGRAGIEQNQDNAIRHQLMEMAAARLASGGSAEPVALGGEPILRSVLDPEHPLAPVPSAGEPQQCPWCTAPVPVDDPFRPLGERLADLLDEDQWKGVERMLNDLRRRFSRAPVEDEGREFWTDKLGCAHPMTDRPAPSEGRGARIADRERLREQIMRDPDVDAEAGAAFYAIEGPAPSEGRGAETGWLTTTDGERELLAAGLDLSQQRWKAEALAQRTRADAAERERDEMAEKWAAQVAGDTNIERLVVESGRFELDMSGDGPRVLTAALIQLYRSGGGHNYLEMHMMDQQNQEQFVVTVQRVGGKTPHQARVDAESEATRLRAALTAAESQRDEAVTLAGEAVVRLHTAGTEMYEEGLEAKGEWWKRLSNDIAARLAKLTKEGTDGA